MQVLLLNPGHKPGQKRIKPSFKGDNWICVIISMTTELNSMAIAVYAIVKKKINLKMLSRLKKWLGRNDFDR